ncbi:type VII secretion integral membrane protein EccD [Mycolicibacterium moriokaense]|nr:type VII secretion integral membrane protein EccD [Mycolicibacterium moriokaense]
MTVDELRRVTVRMHRSGGSSATDLALPTYLELDEMLPDIVDLVDERPDRPHDDVLGRWRLARLDGSPLDESMTLLENDVQDGDVLLLTTMSHIPEPCWTDPSRRVADVLGPADRDVASAGAMSVVAFLWSAVFGAVLLAWPGQSGHRVLVAAVAAVAAIAAAVLVGRGDGDPLCGAALGAAAAMFAAVAGFVAVPGGPAEPNFFLAATVCAAVAIVLPNATPHARSLFVAIAAGSTMVAIATSVMTIWQGPTRTLGAVLATASLVMTNVAPRLSILLTGLTPRMPNTADDRNAPDTVDDEIDTAMAERGHRTLTGLLAGFSLSAAAGVALVAADTGVSAIAFSGAVSIALLMRAGQQRGTPRSAAVLAAGLITCTATFTAAVVAFAGHAAWLCSAAVGLGTAALYATHTNAEARLSPSARRAVDVVDYLALLSVVPLACWVGGVFGFVRELGLG